MTKRIAIILLLCPVLVNAQMLSGSIKNDKGVVLPFSSILIKGTTKGTTANAKGQYSINLAKGNYVLVCQHVGFASVEKKIKISEEHTIVNFELAEQQYKLNDVVVKSGSEDPAYEIIRKTIAKREEYLKEIKKFSTEVYIKGELQLRNYPKRFLGEKVDFEDGDTSKKKMIFLSETVANYSVDNDKKKIEVVSTKVSGRSDGFGFSSPQIISFYENNITLRALNPRGFISPISNNALNYYRYKFEGTFFEGDKQISRIKVIPKRKYEPLFSGYMNIIEDEWRIYSLQLNVFKEQQMQLLDTLTIEQLYMPLKNTWVIKQQVMYPAGKFLGFDFFGHFIQVYDKFDIAPDFKPKFFNNTLLKFFDSSNKKSLQYWDSIRPLPLTQAEAIDYKKKDSLEQLRQQPHYLDSLDQKRNKLTFNKLFFTGYNYSKEKYKTNFTADPLINALGLYYNPAEGRVSVFGVNYNKRFEGRQNLNIKPSVRYGYARQNFNAKLNTSYSFGKKYLNSIALSFGSDVFQFNNENPVSETNNTISTYFWQHNHIRSYMASFFKANYSFGIGEGITIGVGVNYQDRTPMDNVINSLKDNVFAPNYPTEIMVSNIAAHKAFSAQFTASWRPGARYIEFPDRKVNIGSKYPILGISIVRGMPNIFGSDADYTKWKLTVSDNLNMKLGGMLSYNVESGGFLQANKVYAPDYNHYLGNQTALANTYLRSFQLLPYYELSNTKSLYGAAHIEYHLNGLFTNKIPGFRKLNWFLVLGANGLAIAENSRYNYTEVFISLENIFKVGRIDFIKGYKIGADQHNNTISGIRFSIPVMK
ncbi:MAG: carboxypeptidase-like regulatory domain-containing protein [Sphingobacteriia bacterium]|nr:carboxypeptidase-like regulatory domain-containing protein [Sphingobacteriia bacterium]